MNHEDVPKSLKASLVRMFTYLYIDDHPHSLMKMSRCYKAFQPADEYLNESEFARSQELSSEDLEQVFKYIHSYFYRFAKVATGQSFIKAYEMELVKLCKYMLKFGIFTYRNGEFQIKDIDDLFSFLCHILDIFANRKDYQDLKSLDNITQKDQIINDYTQNNPIQKAAFDTKYRLLNKRNWINSEGEIEYKNDIDEGYRASHIHSRVITEIMDIFHFLFDLRQNYLMSNIVEMFHKRVYTQKDGLHLLSNEKDKVLVMKSMIKDFKNVLPDAKDFTQQMSYKFPSIDEMYDDEDFNEYRKQVVNMAGSNLDMHDNFLILLIDTFNVSGKNKYLLQMTLTIICRYYSERSELIRNIERMTLIFNDEEWRFYNWVNITIDRFTRDTEKSSLWLVDLEGYDEDEYIDRVNNNLEELLITLYQKFKINNFDGILTLDYVEGERKINKFAQRVFRSLKVYDHLINFISQNMKLLIKVRTSDVTVLGETERNKTQNIAKVFRKCLDILEAFTLGNKANQSLMWKYKDKFCFPELGNSEEDGELEFVLAIVDGNEDIATTKSLDFFLQNLNKRMGNEENFVILLDIFNKLMDFESSGKIRKSLIKLILKHPEMLDSTRVKTRAQFEASINVKEILFHILKNQGLNYTRDSFISLFKMDELIDRLERSLDLLDKLEKNEEDEEIDEQEYEELRESQQQVLVDIYSNLHFDKAGEDVNLPAIIEFFSEQIEPYYTQKLDHFINNVDLSDTDSYKLSQVKLLILHFQILLKHISD